MDQKERQEQDERLRMKMGAIKNKILVMSGKGGVGKTTVAVNLAYGLVAEGKMVGLIDVDIHGPNVAKMLGIENERLTAVDNMIEPFALFPNFRVVSLALLGHNVDEPFVWRGPLKGGVIKQLLADTNWGELDYLIIDAPPGTGDEPLSVCQLIEDLTAAIIVTTPQDVALLDARKSILFTRQLKVPFIGLIENMSGFVCPECKEEIVLFGAGTGKKVADEFMIEFLGSIPMEPGIVRAGDTGKPFIHFNKETATAQSIKQIVIKTIDIIQSKQRV
jgi:Mrp family chromosome partitioning ATPase